ncbi:hypothetical protein ACLMJK_007233 [Lecanora helva]
MGEHRNSVIASFKSSARAARRVASSFTTSPTQNTDAFTEFPPDGSPPSFSTSRSSTSSKSSLPRPYSSRAGSVSTASLQQQHLADWKPLPSRFIKQDPSNPSLISISPQKRPSTQHSLDGTTLNESPHAENVNPAGSLNMATTTSTFTTGFRPEFSKPPSTSQSNVSFGQGANNATVSAPSLPPAAPVSGMQNPNIIFQQIHDTCSRRISTLDYLRKAHEGRVYWFNTLRLTKSDLAKMPFFEPKRLARRATNYLLLGLSLPNILDLSSSNPQEYLRALHALLSEFESYQQIHPPEGGSASSLSRARLPSILKRATQASTKGRRTSSATDIGLPMNTSDPLDLKAMTSVATAGSNGSSFPASEQDLLPGEEYVHLHTPSLPFDPDFFETFATLCDVLIDCYTKITSLVSSPAVCSPGVGDTFTKADSKLRKVIVSGIIKEFEDASRSGAKAEFAGLGKVVLGGLM